MRTVGSISQVLLEPGVTQNKRYSGQPDIIIVCTTVEKNALLTWAYNQVFI